MNLRKKKLSKDAGMYCKKMVNFDFDNRVERINCLRLAVDECVSSKNTSDLILITEAFVKKGGWG